MIIDWLVITITVITVLFLRGQIPFFLYITIYISISYEYIQGVFDHLIFNCNNCNCNRLGRFTFLPFLYQATECQANFVVHIERIAFEVEAFAGLQRLEVQTVGAVVLTGDRDVLAVEHTRVALRAPGLRLDEREVFLVAEIFAEHVATEHARVTLAGLGDAVAAELGFQIHAEMRVVVPNCFIVLFHFLK